MGAKHATVQVRLERLSQVGSNGCINFVGYCSPDGYGRITVNRKAKMAHRVAYEIHKGVIPDNMEVMHSCDNPCCVNPDHLSVGTHDDNIQDMVIKGRQRGTTMHCGVSNPSAKLNPEKAFEIRWYSAMGRKQSDISKNYGVSSALIGRIIRCEIWKPECHD